MGNVNGKITAPVDIWDPYSAIGAAVPSTGYNIGLLIATEHGRINKWAKYKPVPYYNGPFASSPNHPKYDPEWWKAKYPPGSGHDGDCGLLLPATPDDQTTWFQCADESFKVGYRHPAGGMNAPYRLADFAGYNHRAQCPVRLSMPREMVVSNKPSWLRVSLKFSEWSDDSLKLTDIKPGAAAEMKDMYLTVAVTTASSASVMNSGNTRFFQPEDPVSAGTDMDDSVLQLSLDCGEQASALDTKLTDLGFTIKAGTKVKVLAMLGARLPSTLSTQLPLGRGWRSTDPPTRWTTLYYEDKPSAELTLTEKRVYHEVTAVFTSAKVVMTTQEYDSYMYGYLDLQQLVYKMQNLPSSPIQVYPVITVYTRKNGVDEYLMDHVAVQGSPMTVSTNGATVTHEVMNFPEYLRRFDLPNDEAAAYGTTYTLEIGLNTTAGNTVVSGKLTGTLTLNRSTGIWTVKF